MTPDTLDFTGNATTILGFVGVLSTLLIVYWIFRSYWSSPYRK